MVRKGTMIVLLMMVMAVSGCETVKGMARDIENTGNNLGQIVDIMSERQAAREQK